MLYQCCEDDRTVDIPIGMYIHINDYELKRICTEGYGVQISNPFFCSFVESKGVMLTPEQVEEQEEQEYLEEEDKSACELNLDPDYWE
jgi:hypothetical protein